MRRITITQMNVDGKGGQRVAHLWVKPDQVEVTIRRKSLAYNMDRTTIVAD